MKFRPASGDGHRYLAFGGVSFGRMGDSPGRGMGGEAQRQTRADRASSRRDRCTERQKREFQTVGHWTTEGLSTLRL